MKKPLASRIAGLAALYCAVFFVLVILQFANKGGFSLTAGAMTIRGRYSDDSPVRNDESGFQVTGGIRIYFGGIEFSLNEERGKGLTLIGEDGTVFVNPENLKLTGSSVQIDLPGGTTLNFNSTGAENGQELQIHAVLADNVTEVIIPIIPRRSSIIRENEQLAIMHSGFYYSFNTGRQELENGSIILSRDNSFISYRSRPRQRTFNLADYVIAQAGNYESAFVNWRELSFNQWNQRASSLQSDYDVAGYCTEALGRGNYPTATAGISRDFINSARHTYISAAFVGGMASAHRTFTAAETSKSNLITSLIREKSAVILKEEHIIDYLFVRSNTSLASDVIDIIHDLDTEMIIMDYCPGLLEAHIDIRRWRPAASNPVEPLMNQILKVIAENLTRDIDNDFVFASSSEGTSAEFSLRLGKALMDWAEDSRDTEWQAVGKSLVLSALMSEGPGAGRLYGTVNEELHYPKAVWLNDNGLWAWTAAVNARAANVEGGINIAFTFPVNMSHFVIIRGVRPFSRLQMHGQDWRTDSQFERYDSSGWFYYQQDQILVLKLRHRQAVENVRIIYGAAVPAQTVVSQAARQTEGD